ncbi:MAG: hypothetical protein U0871_04760 [Gemmataceae bacterium]
MRKRWLGVILAVVLTPAVAGAGPLSKLARELAEGAIQKFGGKAAAEGAEALGRKIEGLLVRYGDDAARAIRRSGPRALAAAEEAGAEAGPALRAIARHGDEGAAFVAARPAALKLTARHGDTCADVLVKHRGAVEGVIEAGGEGAVKALAAVGPQNGRRLAMLHAGGELTAIGRTPEVLGVIARYGDPAAEFVWRHKGALATAAVLATFLANPEPYLTGAKELAGEVVRPLAAVPATVAGGVARGTNWTAVLVSGVVAAGALAGLSAWRWPARRTGPPPEGKP